MPDDTLLTLSGIGIAPYSARRVSQTIEIIDEAGDFRRTIDGKLKNVANPAFHKFRSSITCDDVNSPALNGVKKGTELVVGSVVEWSYPTATGSPERPVVTGSSRVEGTHTFYRPELTMMVVSYNINKNELDAIVGWQLDLVEV